LIKDYQGEKGVITYLKNLNNKLEVLTLMGNECSKDSSLKLYAIAFLDKLKYYDYELIDKTIRGQAFDKFEDLIKDEEAKKQSSEKNDENND
jgi:hypothetical protein